MGLTGAVTPVPRALAVLEGAFFLAHPSCWITAHHQPHLTVAMMTAAMQMNNTAHTPGMVMERI